MKKEHKDLIRRYLSDELTLEELKIFHYLKSNDNVFSERFELVKCLTEVDQLEQELLISEDIDSFFDKKLQTNNLRKYLLTGLSILSILVASMYIYSISNPKKQTIHAKIFQTNDNAADGMGFGNSQDSLNNGTIIGNVVLIFLEEKHSADTTYKFINQDSIYFKFPRLSAIKKGRDSIYVNYDFGNGKLYLITGKDTFNMTYSETELKLEKK